MTVRPDFVVDDHAEPVAAFGGEVIRSPHTPLDQDREMFRIYAAIQTFVMGGRMGD